MKRNVFGEFDETGNLKTLLTKNLLKFIDFAKTTAYAQKTVIEAVRKILHFTVMRRGRLVKN